MDRCVPLIVLVAALCIGPVDGFAESVDESIFVRAQIASKRFGEQQKIDPLTYSTTATLALKTDIFEALLTIDRYGKVIGAGAKSWSLNEQGEVWTFHLRDDARWSDGQPVTAADYVFAHERLKHHWQQTNSDINDDSAGLEFRAADALTLEVFMSEPFQVAEVHFVHPHFSPLPGHVGVEDPDVLWSDWPQRLSNGAYTLESMENDGSYILKRNAYVRAELQPAFDKIHHRFLSWGEVAAEFLAGTVDLIWSAPSNQSNYLKNLGYEFVTTSEVTGFFTVNETVDKLADPRVRRALFLAIDRQEMMRRIFSGDDTTRAALDLVPGGLGGWETQALGEDSVELARSLMRAAGYSEENRLQLEVKSNYSVLHERVCHLTGEYWNRIYVDVSVELEKDGFDQYKTTLANGDFEVARFSIKPHQQTPFGFLRNCSTRNSGFVTWRCGFFDNPHFTNLVEDSVEEDDLKERNRMLVEANDILRKYVPLIPIYHSALAIALSPRVEVSPDKVWRLGEPSMLFRPAE